MFLASVREEGVDAGGARGRRGGENGAGISFGWNGWVGKVRMALSGASADGVVLR